MRAIQKYLPCPRHTEIKRIYVCAKPAAAWEAIRHFDAAATPWIRWLFTIRTLPEKITGKNKQPQDTRIGIDQIAENGKGFMILEEIPGKEVVIGSVGQFWHLTIPFAAVRPVDFKEFRKPGWGKLAWAITVEPFYNGSTISLELRTTATDEPSWKKLKNYYRLIGLGSRPIRYSLMHHYEKTLGKLELPVYSKTSLPGDEFLPGAEYVYTHTQKIEAPPSIVWNYLMQLGCDRAGWYSIDLLDHGGKPSVDHLVEGWETREPEDKLDATPAGDGFFNVLAVNRERSFIVGGNGQKLGKDFKMSWAFVLDPIGEDATHLVTRVRMQIQPGLNGWLQGHMIAPPVHGIMQRVQLRRIKQIAERDAQLR